MSLIDELPKPTAPDCVLDYAGILQVLPHRYPFLLVDRLLELDAGKKAVALKHVSFNEPYFSGHFPSEPVMPGVLQVEALAQTLCLLMTLSFDDLRSKRPAFVGIDKTRFRRPVRPGDILRLEIELVNYRRGIATAAGRILVGDQVVCDGELVATMI